MELPPLIVFENRNRIVLDLEILKFSGFCLLPYDVYALDAPTELLGKWLTTSSNSITMDYSDWCDACS